MNTTLSGLALFIPVAEAKALPCGASTASTSRKSYKNTEQPTEVDVIISSLQRMSCLQLINTHYLEYHFYFGRLVYFLEKM